MKQLENLDSKKVFDFFYEISQIPRESKNEKVISDYLKNFAVERNLWVKQDQQGNVIIKKDGTGKLKDAKSVALQGHMDMVCEKEKTSNHNFETDPIKWIIKDDFIFADKTTLGADDGIGVAYALAILDDKTLEHPPLEVVLTVDEETGMSGAIGLDVSDLSAKIFINIDSEEEGKFYLSCAGGNDTKISIPISFKEHKGLLVEVEVSGLVGGHSGLEIIKERANSSKVLARYLNILNEKGINFNLVDINGGNKVNAITRESFSKVLINEKDFDKVEEEAMLLNSKLKNEYNPQDPDIKILISKKEVSNYSAMDTDDSLKVVQALVLIPYGPLNYSKFIPELVQTSSNVGVVTTMGKEVEIKSALRSSIISQKEALVETHAVISKLVGGKIENTGFYPAWPYNEKSRIKELFLEDYKELFNKDAEVVAIHAGLECGLFKEKMGDDVDFISFGPDIFGAHTAEEHVSISSIDRCWTLFKKVLTSIEKY